LSILDPASPISAASGGVELEASIGVRDRVSEVIILDQIPVGGADDEARKRAKALMLSKHAPDSPLEPRNGN
jgi:hypothetical protein